ncbi:Ig-like domain-containing protein [Spirosoma sp. BT702]|uniref:Ig-like domain-containing protein n=1 Tax=Spirosoma profusum TaxID=2771354 RepID=A0A926XY98_9BACT|nr:Ig-like domain-containing protein [Spirosoma profusum]MBD2703159.1 Ig-like domain-containing protein [Spirosoma profusum]
MRKSLLVLCWLIFLGVLTRTAQAQTPVVSGTLSVSLTGDANSNGQVNPGDQLSYTAVISNSGSGSAAGVNLTMPAPTNTTLVTGSLRTSALARPDAYTTLISGTLSATSVLTNDFGLPTKTVSAFGPSVSPANVVANGSNSSPTDQGGNVVVNTDGTFSYTPTGSFVGYDRFGYTATTTTTLPNDAATVTIGVGTPVTALPNAYTITGNVTNTQSSTATGLLGNDTGDQRVVTTVRGGSGTANVGVAITTAQNGTVIVSANGTFVYEPLAGYTGSDSFTYTANNGLNLPSSAVVTLTIQNMIWFVDAGAATNGTGTLAKPFNNLVSFKTINIGAGGTTNGDPGDNIFLYSGSYTVTLDLLNNQKLIGAGASASLASIAGITPAPGSAALPSTGGTAPQIINNVGGSHVIGLAQNNLLRGITVGGATTSAAISGVNFNTLTVSETTINNAGPGLYLTNGTVIGSFDSITSTAGNNNIAFSNVNGSLSINGGLWSGASGISFSIFGGTVNITYNGSLNQANNSQMVDVQAGHSGMITFQTGTLNATNGSGLNFNNADGTYNFNGTTTLNGGDAGIDITNGSSGTFSFGSNTSITNPSGITYREDTSTPTVTYNGSLIKTNNATTAVYITGKTGGTTSFNGAITASTSTTTAINLTSNTGSSVTFGGNNLAIATSTGTGFNATGGGTVNVTGTGNTIIKVGNGNALNIGSTNAGVSGINFSSINVTGGTGTAVNISSSTGTKNLGDVDVARNGGGTGIFASNAGTVNTTDGTINSGNQTAIDIDNTVLGIILRSVASNGASIGIDLNTTTGSFAVTGSGSTDGSGGTIQNIAQRGVQLINSQNVTLKNITFINANTQDAAAPINDMGSESEVPSFPSASAANGVIYLSSVSGINLNNIDISGTTAQMGITGVNVSNFTLTGSTITNAGDGVYVAGGGNFEDAIRMANLSGTCFITNSTLSFSETNTVDVFNRDKNLTLTIDGSTFRDTQTTSSGGPTNGNGEGGFQFRSFSSAAGSPVSTIKIKNSSFLRLRTQGIQTFASSDCILNVDITNTTIDCENDIGAGIDINGDQTSQVYFNIIGNPKIQSRGGSAVNITAFVDADVMGRINNNPNIIANGMGAGGSGVRVLPQENTAHAIVEVSSNTITMGTGNNSTPIDVQARIQASRLDITLNNNTLHADPTALANINITAGSSAASETSQVYAHILNNDIAPGGPTNILRLRVSDLDGTSNPLMFLQGFLDGGTGIDDDAVATWNTNGNTPTVTAANVNVSLTGTATAPSAGVPLIPTNPLP